MGTQDTPEPGRRAEWLLGLSAAALMAVAALPGYGSHQQNTHTRAAAERICSLVDLARDQAMLSGRDHLVYFAPKSDLASLEGGNGERVVALLARGTHTDGVLPSWDHVSSVVIEPDAPTDWGSNRASVPAPADPASRLDGGWSFVQPDGENRANGLVFSADGRPRAFGALSPYFGEAGSGAGALYLRSPQRDFAVVLLPDGLTRVHTWDVSMREWR